MGGAPLDDDAMELGAIGGHTAVVQMVFDHTHVHRTSLNRPLPLQHPAEKGHTELAELLLRHRADPTLRNAEGRSPIDIAQSFGHTAVVTLLKSAAGKPVEQ